MIPEKSPKNPEYHKPHLVKITLDNLYNTMLSPEVYVHAGVPENRSLAEFTGTVSCRYGWTRIGQASGVRECAEGWRINEIAGTRECEPRLP